jgi:hypothetical protein
MLSDPTRRTPLAHFTDLLNKAEGELLMEIASLPRNRMEILRKPAVIDRYFPPEVYRKMCDDPNLLCAFNAIHELESITMPDRRSLTVMMARTNGTCQPNTSQESERPLQNTTPADGNGIFHDDSASSESVSPPPAETQHPGTPQNQLGRYSRRASAASTLPSSLLQVPIDRRLAVDSPAAPNPSPALSNDAGETLGNLAQLTRRLELARGRADVDGIIPQTRFSSPQDWPGKRSC